MNAPLIAALAALFIILFLIGERLSNALKHRKEKGNKHKKSLADYSEKPSFIDFYDLPEAGKETTPSFAVIDFQTTGLSTSPGEEAPIIQAAWLILNKDFQVIKHRLRLIRQTERSGYEAQMVHHIPYEKILEYGLPEAEVLGELISDLSGDLTIVFHNAEFDLAILRGGLTRTSLPAREVLSSKPVLCTMTCLTESAAGEKEEKYLSLPVLTARLTGKTLPLSALSGGLTVWRNVCLTRICLQRLLELHPAEFATHSRPASDILSSL